MRAAAGWDPEASDVVLPVAETLLRMSAGTERVVLDGLTFEHATWL